MSIDDCVNLALKNTPAIRKYKDLQQMQKNAVGIAKSNYFPTLFGEQVIILATQEFWQPR